VSPAPDGSRAEALARDLATARESRTPLAPIRSRLADGGIAAAYEVQQKGVARLLSAGDRVVGRKVGLTSVAVQKQLGVDRPDFGTLMASMEVLSGEDIPYDFIAPRVEAEVAFILARDLTSEIVTPSDLMGAIAWATPAIEIVDSRIEGWKIGILDTIADNASSARYVLGPERRRVEGLDLRLCGMVLEKNGEVSSLGVGAACLGHPLLAALWLARTMATHGEPLREGDVILSGALGPMVGVSSGDRVSATIQGLGSVSVSFDAIDSGRRREP
jgi:2-keto-4-pentenoate hydratase